MQAIATNEIAWSLCLTLCWSVCQLVTFMSHAKTTEPIKMLFRWMTWVGPRNHVIDGG